MWLLADSGSVVRTLTKTADVFDRNARGGNSGSPSPGRLIEATLPHARLRRRVADGQRVEVPDVPIHRHLLQEGEPKLPADILGGMVGWVDYCQQFA